MMKLWNHVRGVLLYCFGEERFGILYAIFAIEENVFFMLLAFLPTGDLMLWAFLPTGDSIIFDVVGIFANGGF